MMLTCTALLLTACVAAEDVAQPDPAEAWLDKIEAKAGEVTSLTAKMTYTREQGLLGDKQHRFGTLTYQAGPPAKFQARFDKLAVDGALHEMDKAYVFDGRYIVERDEDERIWTRQELAKEGEQVDLLALGEGPFSLPLNMKKARVLERFTAALVDDGDDQPLHLVLTPREGQDLDVTEVELWFARDTLLPVRARQEQEDDATNVKLSEMLVNPEAINEAFDTSPPTDEGWQINDHPLEEDAQEPAR